MAYRSDTYNFDEWFEFIKDKIFLIRNYRRIGDWTPKELEEKDPDQSQFEQGDQAFNYGMIEYFVELPDGDVLLAIRYLHPETMDAEEFLAFKKLSEVSLIMPDVALDVEEESSSDDLS